MQTMLTIVHIVLGLTKKNVYLGIENYRYIYTHILITHITPRSLYTLYMCTIVSIYEKQVHKL